MKRGTVDIYLPLELGVQKRGGWFRFRSWGVLFVFVLPPPFLFCTPRITAVPTTSGTVPPGGETEVDARVFALSITMSKADNDGTPCDDQRVQLV